MNENIYKKFRLIEELLKTEFSDSWKEVHHLVSLIPENLSKESFWQFGKDKPCWSNIKVNIGRRIANDLEKHSDFKQYELICDSGWDIHMKTAGSGWKINSNFEAKGETVSEFLHHLEKGGLKSYLWKLFAIREFAIAMQHSQKLNDMIDKIVLNPTLLISENVYGWSRQFAMLAGRGWGAITVNHLLTDLGLAVKPDVHLKRSTVRLGLIKGVPSNLPIKEIDNLGTKYDAAAVASALKLSAHINSSE